MRLGALTEPFEKREECGTVRDRRGPAIGNHLLVSASLFLVKPLFRMGDTGERAVLLTAETYRMHSAAFDVSFDHEHPVGEAALDAIAFREGRPCCGHAEGIFADKASARVEKPRGKFAVGCG